MAQKKSFKADLNPAMQFISTPAQEQPSGSAATAPEGYKANPLYVETKSKRFQLLLQPSLYNKIKARAAEQGESVNNAIHTILEEAMRGE